MWVRNLANGVSASTSTPPVGVDVDAVVKIVDLIEEIDAGDEFCAEVKVMSESDTVSETVSWVGEPLGFSPPLVFGWTVGLETFWVSLHSSTILDHLP